MGFSIIQADDHIDTTFNATDECFLKEKNLIESNGPLMYMIAVDQVYYGISFHNCNGDKLSYDVLYTSKHHNEYLRATLKSFPHATWSIVALCFLMLGLYWIHVFRTSQHALQNFHYMFTAIIFLLVLYNVLYTFKLYIIDSPGDRERNWITFMSLFYLFAILIGTGVLIVQGWNFVKSVFGRKERRCLEVALSIQTSMWAFQYCVESFPVIGYSEYFEIFLLLEIFVVFLMNIYLCIRKAGTRRHKALDNLKKFQLFRFGYLMIVFCFYIAAIIISIFRLTYSVPFLKYLYFFYEDITRFVFLAVIGYKFQPKFLSEILALGNEGEVLPITDLNKDDVDNKDDQ
ncbi:unnamed protein product [Diamesa tonsa]